jgi:hypothetical protein
VLAIPLNDTVIYQSVAASPYATPVPLETNSADNFVVIHDIATGIGTSFAAFSIGLSEFVSHSALAGSSLLFLRGLASPQWLATTGEEVSCQSRALSQAFGVSSFHVQSAESLLIAILAVIVCPWLPIDHPNKSAHEMSAFLGTSPETCNKLVSLRERR